LTGGTVTGATTFSAAGAGLAVTNNATIGGTLGVTGLITATGGVTSPNGGGAFSAPQYNTPGNTFTGASTPIPPRLNINLNLAGTITGASFVNLLNISGDTANCTGAGDGGCFDLGLIENVGASATGGRGTIWSQLNVGALTAGSLEMTGINSTIFVSGNSNGAFIQPINSNVSVLSGGSSASTLNEFDYEVASGGSTNIKGGLQITLGGGDAVAGAIEDAGIFFSNANAAGASPGMGSILSLGTIGEGWPVNPTTGSIIGIILQIENQSSGRNEQFIPTQALNGIDLAKAYFSGNAYDSAGFSVTGSDVLSLGQLTITPTSSGVLFDTPRELLSAAVVANGGTGSGGIGCYYVGDIVGDVYNDQLQVATVSGCQAATFTILTKGSTASPPGSPVAMVGGSGAGLTATLTFAAAPTLNIGTASATAINIGSAISNVLFGSGSALATTATIGFPLIPSSAGTPTGTVAGVGGGKVAIEIDTTDKKFCYSVAGGTWECSAAFTP
jgi:hypothetical protein